LPELTNNLKLAESQKSFVSFSLKNLEKCHAGVIFTAFCLYLTIFVFMNRIYNEMINNQKTGLIS